MYSQAARLEALKAAESLKDVAVEARESVNAIRRDLKNSSLKNVDNALEKAELLESLASNAENVGRLFYRQALEMFYGTKYSA